MNIFVSTFLSIWGLWPNRVVIICIAIALYFFMFQFLWRAISLGRELKRATKSLAEIENDTKGKDFVGLEQITLKVMITKSLKHLWNQYIETLHSQKVVDDYGQEQVIRYRATNMAETFFTDQVIVDTHLKTEFYKHLPGILTGLGIIGTFSGLIQGLSNFQVSSDPNAVRACLSNLIQGVGHAFYLSATAIALAMVFTCIEKILIAGRYRQVEEFRQAIDRFFSAGAGEEYLARMVSASETSATQATMLKDSLVTDLKQILSEVTAQQVQSATQNTQKMSIDLAQAFTDTMRLPLERISDAVAHVSNSQGDAVNTMLTDVLVSFSTQMQDMFGGQFRGMTDLLSQTNNAMLGTVSKFDQLAENLQNAGQGAADAMAERLHEAIVAMERRQEDMTLQMQDFVEQMRSISRDSQTESSQRMQTIMNELGDQIALMVARMDEQAKTTTGVHNDSLNKMTHMIESVLTTTKEAMNEAHQHTAQASRQVVENLGEQVQETFSNLQEMAKRSEDANASRQAELAEQSAKLLSNLATQVDTLGRRVADAAESTQNSAAVLASVTKSGIERMNAGADSLLLAISEFSDVEKRVAGTIGAIGQTAQTLQASANTLNGASIGVQRLFDDYKSSTGTFAITIKELNGIVETTRREASLTANLIHRLEGASEKLAAASGEADQYLEGVSEVLGAAHSSFAENVTKTLHEGNSQFHRELAEAVGYLKSAILDLGDTLESVPSRN